MKEHIGLHVSYLVLAKHCIGLRLNHKECNHNYLASNSEFDKKNLFSLSCSTNKITHCNFDMDKVLISLIQLWKYSGCKIFIEAPLSIMIIHRFHQNEKICKVAYDVGSSF